MAGGCLHQVVFNGPAVQRIGNGHCSRSYGQPRPDRLLRSVYSGSINSGCRRCSCTWEPLCGPYCGPYERVLQLDFWVCTIFMAEPIRAETSVMLLGTMRVVVASWATLP